jgi:hypothetical protein
MALNKIKTASITDDAVNADKLAAGSVTNSELNKTAITGQTELSETANDADFTIIFDTSASALKKVLRSNLKQSGPTISSVSPTNANESAGTNITITIAGSGFTVGSTARLIGNTGKVQEFDTVTRASATSMTGTLAFSSFEQAQEPYDVQVTNGEGLSSLLANQINVNASPVFVTSAGTLGTILNGQRTGVRKTVVATDPDSAANVTFELQSGSLPAGLALTSEGSEGGTAVISGNATAVGTNTTSNFVLRAVDSASNTSSRAFSITINAPVSQSFTSSGTFAVPSGLTALDVLVVAGGGGGAMGATGSPGGGGGGGGAGGLIFMPSYPVTPGGTIAVTVGSGGTNNTSAGASASSPHKGQDSVFAGSPSPGIGQGGILTAKGGGGGGAYAGGAGGCGGSGGGGGAGSTSHPTTAGPANQSTQPGNSGAYGFGNNGAAGNTGGTAGGGAGGGAATAGVGGGFGGGQGGTGKSYTIADGTTAVFYAGGAGGGQGSPGQQSCGQGGQGGGGQGGTSGGHGTAGQANTGGGGGGGSYDGGQGNSGGKGIVIVRY